MTYTVTLVAQADVSTHITVEAASQQEAERKAVEQARGDKAEWMYDGVDDESIEVCLEAH